MIAYFDSSALVKLLVDEEGSALAAALWDSCDASVSSRLAHAEVCAAISAGARAKRLSDGARKQAHATWSLLARSMRWVELNKDVTIEAGELAGRHPLSGADAAHLASCLALGKDGVVLVTWDLRLWTAAHQEHMSVVPRELG